ncbi:MT-A70 family [Aspergillus saccharolyticus JOP 1030-1]|uniref:MT-A70-domain-containing protein n=1 Tax=Aspergillus saccharolyticus JOP 1030-1 TaxID=1450539 RepID=A0A318ZJM4_9EURO|nr:MT-A70-domain-containing protein [Aspergillus saccharolyticus JOP 1030-1]PYH47781.1 MT-A70-domain-containing protein [Aspergillus saccharolyticus JOP 1030-1]
MIAPSSILYQDPQATTFLIDIPTSIARAQLLSLHQLELLSPAGSLSDLEGNGRNRVVLSTPPLREPYPAHTEPKTDAARTRVLERIPVSERLFHSEILEPLVTEGLLQIRNALKPGFAWCLPRVEVNHSTPQWVPRHGNEALRPDRRKATGSTRSDSFPLIKAASKQMDSDTADPATLNETCISSQSPPLILSPGTNSFSSMSELFSLVVRNTSREPAVVQAPCMMVQMEMESPGCFHSRQDHLSHSALRSFYVPPLSSFIQGRIPVADPGAHTDSPIPGLPHHQKFNLILLDPPWANRSVRRSGHYQTQTHLDWERLTRCIRQILSVHLVPDPSRRLTRDEEAGQQEDSGRVGAIAAIWITNSGKARKTAYEAMQGAGLTVCEEWIWVKTTTEGEPITPVEALWRKPYEILVIGRRVDSAPDNNVITRRVIAAVPDIHSRKPNLREVFEQVFLLGGPPDEAGMRYTALEVFARNLTAGWWAVGDEALKFNSEEWWIER